MRLMNAFGVVFLVFFCGNIYSAEMLDICRNSDVKDKVLKAVFKPLKEDVDESSVSDLVSKIKPEVTNITVNSIESNGGKIHCNARFVFSLKNLNGKVYTENAAVAFFDHYSLKKAGKKHCGEIDIIRNPDFFGENGSAGFFIGYSVDKIESLKVMVFGDTTYAGYFEFIVKMGGLKSNGRKK